MAFETIDTIINTKERLDASTQTDRHTRTASVYRESAILVGVYLKGEGRVKKNGGENIGKNGGENGDASLDELAELAAAARVRVAGKLVQRRDRPEAKTYIGSGKLIELKELVAARDADLVIFDNDLGPAQTRNLEQELKVKVLDRTELILDIFASRAQTAEARLAVELAQLEYAMPRLKQMWTHLERQGVGGVGLRGPGEKQLEVDRRLAQKRINDLKAELDVIHRRKQREVAARNHSRTVSLVGYTNAGKSTLLNILTGADEFVKDLLFATLDTRTRRWHLPGWGPVLLSDTVGFIRDLPHHLVASFRATLEEAMQADLLLHVADAANPEVVQQISSAYRVLDEIGIREKDTLLVLNKTDAATADTLHTLAEKYPTAILLSAHTQMGIDKLIAAVSDALSRDFLTLTLRFPVSNGRVAAFIACEGEIFSKHYTSENVTIECRLPHHAAGQLKKESEIEWL